MILCSNSCACMCVTLDVRVRKVHWLRTSMNRLGSAFLVFLVPPTTCYYDQPKTTPTSNRNSSASAPAAATALKSLVTGISCTGISIRARHHAHTHTHYAVVVVNVCVFFTIPFFHSIVAVRCCVLSKYVFVNAIETCIRTTCYWKTCIIQQKNLLKIC